MLGKIFYNIIIFGTIISLCIFPLLMFLSKNKYKYNFKSIYKVFVFILILLILPINFINFSQLKNIKHNKNIEKSPNVVEKELEFTQIPEIVIEKENIIIEVNDSINIKNDTFFNISKVLPYIWCIIAISILLYNLLSYILFLYNQKRYYISDVNINIDKIIEKLCSDMKIKRVNYKISGNVLTPMTIGLFNKRIIFSKEILEEKEYELILRHELFHIKNRDIEYKFLLLILKCIYWFNPIIYMFANQVDEILELNCDEHVLQGKEQVYRIEYAQTLLNQIENSKKMKYKFSMNFANRRKNIMKRFSNIVDKSKKKSIISIATMSGILLIISTLIIVSIPNINFASIQENMLENINNEIDENNTDDVKLEENGESTKTQEESVLVPTNQDDVIIDNTSNSKSKIEFNNPLEGGTLSSRFGKMSNNTTHTGIDIVADSGTDILACSAGKVKYSGYHGQHGNLVVIEHDNGMQTCYAHCSRLCVDVNQQVNDGDVIAKVGSTGNSTGPHLHLEVRDKENMPLNPELYVNFNNREQ